MKGCLKKLLGKVVMALVLVVALAVALPQQVTQAAEIDKNGIVVQYNQTYSMNDLAPKTNTWYKFTTVGNCADYKIHVKNIDIQFYTHGGGFKCYLYDEDGAEVNLWKFSNTGTEYDYWTSLKENTTYYLCFATAWYGGNATFSLSNESDGPETLETAQALKFGEMLYENSRISYDSDWYTFKTSKTATVQKIYVKNIDIDFYTHGGGFNSYLYDEDGSLLRSDYVGMGREFEYCVKLQPNKQYYIRFCNGQPVGKYKFSVSNVKEEGDTKKTASGIKLKKTIKKLVNAPGDIDWYKFKATKTKKYKLTVKNVNVSGSIVVELYSGKKKIASVSVLAQKTNKKTVKLKKNKKYYVKIYSANSGEMGKYNFKIK